jgi:protoporphyrinogen/coproporphyrinogen III oxidase
VSSNPATIAVIGGGITGLSAAYKLAGNPDVRAVLFEATDTLGGQIATHKEGRSWVELGADSFLARDPWAIDLCRELGLQEDLITPAVFGACIWWRGRLRRMPAGTMLGIPLHMGPVSRSGLLSPRGVARASAERFNRAPLRGPDISVARFVSQRFGREVLDRLVDPMLAGTRAGDARRVSLAAALPEVDALARRYPSLLRAGRSVEAPPPRFYSLTGGLETLIDALKRHLSSVSIQLHTAVTSLEEEDGEGVILRFARREPLRADGVVVALPPPQAARLMTTADARTAEQLAAMPYSTASLITMWFRRRDGLRIPPGGSGFLVPTRVRRTVAACTWWSRKWPVAQSDEDLEVLRCFIAGGAPGEEDNRLIDRAMDDLGPMMGVTKRPFQAIVSQWDPALPLFEVGHLDRAASIHHAMAAHPHVVLAGIPERGSGITECVRRGIAAAEQVVGSSVSPAR